MDASGFIGGSAVIRTLMRTLQLVSRPDVVVLLRGERGTGKNQAAKYIHRVSRRLDEAFSMVNCAGLAPGLIESELFGHVRGAFTGAVAENPGLISAADNGTLFLDEIGATSLEFQSRLLHLVEEREYRPVGGKIRKRLNAQIVVATNVNLPRAVREGRFLPDLFDRLNVFPIRIPPLRERAEDIPPLLRYFFGREKRYDLWKILERRYLEFLSRQTWPGNVRQVRNFVTRISIVGKSALVSEENVQNLYEQGNCSDWEV